MRVLVDRPHRVFYLIVRDKDHTLGPSAEEIETTYDVADDWAVIIPGGTWHNVINSGSSPLRLYSLYTPPEHEPGAVHRTRADAEAAEADHHGH